jgi:hypothetical protein
MTADIKKLLPLPTAARTDLSWIGDSKPRKYFTEQQMLDYARAVLAASDERKDAERYRKLVGAMRVTEWTGAGYTYSVFLPAKRADSDVGLILDAAIAAGKAGVGVKP